MTYQEILEEFDRRRSNPQMTLISPDVLVVDTGGVILDLQWAIQSILEKLRDKENG